jgi:hypothetical protein
VRSNGRADDTWARAAALEAVATVVRVETKNLTLGHNARRVDRPVALVIVPLDMFEAARRRDARPLVERARAPT